MLCIRARLSRIHYKAVMDGLKAVPFKEFAFFRSLFRRAIKAQERYWLKRMCENRICQFSPEGTAELSPGR
jgi:hypothetical protein